MFKLFMMCKHIPWCIIIFKHSIIHNHDSAYISCNIFHTMRNQNYCNSSFLPQLLYTFKNVISALWIQSCRWFIKYKHLWFHGKYACYCNSSFLTA